jgi:prepilin-type N-terminal cleavage/methylation domain-containing protein
MLRINLPRRRRGFSLVELLITVFVGALIAGGVAEIMLSQMRLTATQNRNIVNEQTLRENLAYMSDEINSMGNNADEPYIDIIEPEEFQFVGDIDNDGQIDQINYLLDEDELVRTISTSTDGGTTFDLVSTDTLIDHVDEFEFTYFALGNDETEVADDVTAVELYVRLDPSAGETALTAGATADERHVTRVTIRNRTLD